MYRLVAMGMAVLGGTGCIGYLLGYKDIPPREAYELEHDTQCQAQSKGDPEGLRKCQAQVDRKWSRYWSEGKRYPQTAGPEVTGCDAPMDCRGR